MKSLIAAFFLLGYFVPFPDISTTGIDIPISSLPPTLTKTVEISAESALIFDRESGILLYEKNPHEERAMASLTKLMTAFVIFQEKNIFSSAVVPLEATEIEGAKMHLFAGEELLIVDLLRSILIRSANDAAITLAHSVGENFMNKMNAAARTLGLKNTHFQNPHGLDEDNHYSSAFDMAILADKLLENDFVRETAQRRSMTIYDVSKKFSHPIKTTNKLLGTSFPIYGLKTGTTDEAGQCFIGLTKRDGREYILVFMGSEDRFLDTKALLWVLENAEKKS